MSASEKLKALMSASHTNKQADAEVMLALPEIIAVVEAAERCKPLHPTLTAYVSLGALEPLHEALAALEEKLS